MEKLTKEQEIEIMKSAIKMAKTEIKEWTAFLKTAERNLEKIKMKVE